MIQQYYYVSMVKPSTNQKTLLMGPYKTGQEARKMIYDAKCKAYQHDNRLAFCSFGTAGSHLKIKTLFGK